MPLTQEAIDDHQYIVDQASAALKAAHAMYSSVPLTRECLEDVEKIRDDMRILQAHYLDGEGYGELTQHELVVLGRLEFMADNLLTAEANHSKRDHCGSVDTTPTALRPRKKRVRKNAKRRHVAPDMASASTRRSSRGGKHAK